MNSGGQDPDIAAAYAADAAMGATVEMAMYAIELAGKRRAEPAEDLTTLVLAMEVDGEAMTDVQFGSFFVQIVTAGNDTTRTMLSSGLLALLQHPDQLAELRADPSLIPDAVEEILRWANPLHYFRRTATADTELGGASIRTGDKVAMIYTSANRDETVFVRPQEFDIHRDPNPHLSFGTGEHFCLGIHLAAPRGPRVLRGAAGALPHHRARGRAPPPTLEPQQRPQGAPGPRSRPADRVRPSASAQRLGDHESHQAGGDDDGRDEAPAAEPLLEEQPSQCGAEHDRGLAQRRHVADRRVAHRDEHDRVRGGETDAGHEVSGPRRAHRRDERRTAAPRHADDGEDETGHARERDAVREAVGRVA